VFLHFGQMTFLPAWILGVLILWPHSGQLKSMTVDAAGTTKISPHSGHRPRLPVCPSSTLIL
jgi:hypothetical protein